jgi:hypothetical protein
MTMTTAAQAQRPVTDRQLGYITSLLDSREMPEAGYPWGPTLQHFQAHLERHGMTMAQASRVIEYLKALPLKPSAPVAPAQLSAGVYRASVTGEGQPGELYRVYPARGHGGMLAKEIIQDEDGVRFEYAGAARRFVSPSGRLSPGRGQGVRCHHRLLHRVRCRAHRPGQHRGRHRPDLRWQVLTGPSGRDRGRTAPVPTRGPSVLGT